MSITVDTVNLRFNIKPQYDQQQLNELKDDLKAVEKDFRITAKEVEQSAREYKKLNEQLKNMKDNRDRLAAQKSRTPEEEQQLQRLNKSIAEQNKKFNITIESMGICSEGTGSKLWPCKMPKRNWMNIQRKLVLTNCPSTN